VDGVARENCCKSGKIFSHLVLAVDVFIDVGSRAFKAALMD